jgi:transcriptional regulator with XRE-family HTH domain
VGLFSHPGLELARRLRNAMLDRGYSVEALARAVAVHMPDRVVEVRELEAFLSGLAVPLPTERDALAAALGIDIDQLQIETLRVRLETHPDCASRRVSSMMEAA